ncbi:MAG: hypothetical protein V1487_00775 [bacterium]
MNGLAKKILVASLILVFGGLAYFYLRVRYPDLSLWRESKIVGVNAMAQVPELYQQMVERGNLSQGVLAEVHIQGKIVSKMWHDEEGNYWVKVKLQRLGRATWVLLGTAESPWASVQKAKRGQVGYTQTWTKTGMEELGAMLGKGAPMVFSLTTQDPGTVVGGEIEECDKECVALRKDESRYWQNNQKLVEATPRMADWGSAPLQVGRATLLIVYEK